MTIKERVLSQMKTSYAKYGFKREELNQLASIVATNLNDESTDSDILSSVLGAESYAQMMQSVYNRGVTETNAKYKDYTAPQPKKTDDKPAEPAPITTPKQVSSDEIQKMIQEQIKANEKAIEEAVNKAIAPYVEREEKARLNTLLQNHAKVKTIPEAFRNKYVLDAEDKLEETVARIEADWTSTKQALAASGEFVQAPPKADPQSETDDFVKQMQGFSQRKAEASKQ